VLQNYFHDQNDQYWFKNEHKRATSIQKHRSVGFDNRAFAAQQRVLQQKSPILLQKSAIMTAKRLTRFFEVLVAACSIGSLLWRCGLTPAAATQHTQRLVLVVVGRPV
jgi:hypothetical protein